MMKQLAIDSAAFWSPRHRLLHPDSHHQRLAVPPGAPLLIVDDPDTVTSRAVAAGAVEASTVSDEHGWRVGRIIDPFGHEWESTVRHRVADGLVSSAAPAESNVEPHLDLLGIFRVRDQT